MKKKTSSEKEWNLAADVSKARINQEKKMSQKQMD